MAIRSVVTRGFGNGTFNGTIPLVTLRGYSIGEVAISPVIGREGGGGYAGGRKRRKENIIKDDNELMLIIQKAIPAILKYLRR